MGKVMQISEAGMVAFHALAILAREQGLRIKGDKIAGALKVSQGHLEKILQTLEKHGLISAVRGPAGGYLLAKDSRRITLLEIYEAIEGKLVPEECFWDKTVCSGRKCLLGGLSESVHRQVRDYLSKTRLSEVKDIYR